MTTRHFFNQTQPLPAPVREEGMAERWLNRKNPRRCWSYSGTETRHGDCGIDCLACAAGQSFGEYAAQALPDWSEPVITLTPYTEDDDAPTNPMTAPIPLIRSPYKRIERNPDHLLKLRHSGTWIVERTS